MRPGPGHAEEQRLVFPDLEIFRRAALLLADRGVSLRSVDPSAGAAGLSGFITGLRPVGQIWVAARDIERVLDLLEEHDLPAALPLVDRSDPACPACATRLSAETPACPACGLRVNWVDIEEAASDPTGRRCACGYDLTGNREGRCPECGAQIPFDVAGAVRDDDRAAASDQPPSAGQRRLRLGLASIVLIGGGMAMMEDERLAGLGAVLLAGGLVCLLALLLAR
jgi:hypothetical protein